MDTHFRILNPYYGSGESQSSDSGSSQLRRDPSELQARIGDDFQGGKVSTFGDLPQDIQKLWAAKLNK